MIKCLVFEPLKTNCPTKGTNYSSQTFKIFKILLMGIIGYPIPMVRLWLSVRPTISALNFTKQAWRPRGCRGYHGTPRFLANQLTLYQPGGADYGYYICARPPRFSELVSFLKSSDPIRLELMKRYSFAQILDYLILRHICHQFDLSVWSISDVSNILSNTSIVIYVFNLFSTFPKNAVCLSRMQFFCHFDW